MADDCELSFGGRIAITADGVRMTPSEADIEIEPTNIEVEAKVNGDGSMCRTVKPKLHLMKVKFRDRSGIVWNDMMRKCKLDVVADEIDNNRQHLMTGACFAGKPSVNRSTGEVDGIEIAGPQYQMITG